MRLPSILQRHRVLAPTLAVGLVATLVAVTTGVFTSQSSSAPLAQTNPQAILDALRTPAGEGYSATILAQLSFGLPTVDSDNADLSTDSVGAASPLDSSTLALVTGSHTMNYWYGGPRQQRIALLGPSSEIDVFRDGDQAWQWNSDTEVVTKSPVPVGADLASAPLTFAALTPLELTSRVLAAIDSSTTVTLGEQRQVAHRPCYELVITPPTTADTRIGSVRIAVDGATKIPMGVQVYPRGSASAAIDVSFTSLTIRTPSADNFTFSPPPGVAVAGAGIAALATTSARPSASPAEQRQVARAHAGWGAIDSYRLADAAVSAGILASVPSSPTILQPVSGTWGTGRLFDAPLMCVLILDDGRMYVGSVAPAALFAAAATPAASAH